jgi:hypothetical protein
MGFPNEPLFFRQKNKEKQGLFRQLLGVQKSQEKKKAPLAPRSKLQGFFDP